MRFILCLFFILGNAQCSEKENTDKANKHLQENYFIKTKISKKVNIKLTGLIDRDNQFTKTYSVFKIEF
jgi:hypothetical protein